MRASTAFFVGIGTVGIALVAGLGGGLVIGNIMSPTPEKYGPVIADAAKAAPSSQPAPHGQSGPPPMPAAGALPYASATLAFTDPAIDGRPPQADQHADSNATPKPAQSASTAGDAAAKPADSASANPQAHEAAAAKQASAPEDAYAKASDSDLKPADKHRAERAQRWADRHRRDQNQNADQQANGDRNSGRNDDDRNAGRNNSGYRYSDNYPPRVYQNDGRVRYRDAERDYPDDRDPRGDVDDGPRFGFPGVQLFSPDD